MSADSSVDSVDDLVELMSPTVECVTIDDAPDGQAPYASCPVADGLELSPLVFPTAEDRLQDPETFYGPNSNNSGACTELDPQASDTGDPSEGFYYVASDNWHIYLPMFQEAGAEEALQVMANLATTLNAELTFCHD